jgi:BCD family chlorophyll transporter-like MFS transporter
VIISYLLQNYTHERLIRVMQGSAVTFIVLTLIALWNRERLRNDGKVHNYNPTEATRIRLTLGESTRMLLKQPAMRTLFLILFIATGAFATHDVLLEPYGGQVLGMSVAETTQLTALWGVAMILSVTGAGWLMWRGHSPVFTLVTGCGVGALGFLVISVASDAAMVLPFQGGVWLIGAGRGMFIVGSVALVMSLTDMRRAGLFIGLWGVMQALAQGFGTIGGGLVRDVAQWYTGSVALGYTIVYSVSLALLVLALVLVVVLRFARQMRESSGRISWDDLQDIPAEQMVF